MTEQNGLSAVAASGAAFSNRRQKNLQKFRRHIASQRHCTDVKGSSSSDQHDDPILDEKVAIEQGREQAKKCEDKPVKSEEISKPVEDNEKPQLALSPAPPNEGPSPLVSPDQPSISTCGTVLSPQTSKRRYDIMKKLTKKSRHVLAGTSPRKEDVVHRSKFNEDGPLPPLMPAMSDPGDNSNNKAETSEITDFPSDAAQREKETNERKCNEEGPLPPLMPAMSDPGDNSSNKAETSGVLYVPSDASQRHTETNERKSNEDGPLPPHPGDNSSNKAETSGIINLPSDAAQRDTSRKSTNQTNGSPLGVTLNVETVESGKNLSEDNGEGTESDNTTKESVTKTHAENVVNNDGFGVEAIGQKFSSINQATSEHELELSEDTKLKIGDGYKKVLSRPDPPETKNSKVTAHQLCDPPCSFDLRSIHEFPPKPIEEARAALPSRDPSWDTAKVLFNEFQKPIALKPEKDAINLFDTSDAAPWGANETMTFSASFEPGFDSFGDENKDMNLSALPANADPLSQQNVSETGKSPSSAQSPRHRLSRLLLNSPGPSFGFDVSKLTIDSADELDKLKNAKESDESNPEDDTNLLVDNDQMGEDSDGQVWINDSQPTKEERLQLYISTTVGEDDSSISSSNEEEDDDESTVFSQNQEDVAYMPQMEEKKEDDEYTQSRTGLDNMPAQIVDDAPAFVLAAEAAASASLHYVLSGTAATTQLSEGALNALSEFSVPQGAMMIDSQERKGSKESVSATFVEERDKVGGVTPEIEQYGEAYISKSSSSGSSNVSAQKVKVHKKSRTEDGADSSPGNSSDDNPNEETDSELLDLEESTSLVGVSLVPSFGTGAKIPTKSPRSREGMPPRGSLSPIMLPPPPPPLSKRKKKKRTGSKKNVPKINPPPEEKLQIWLDSKEKALHLNSESTPKASNLEAIGFRTETQAKPKPPHAEELSCGAFQEKELWEPPESPGRIHISCGDYTGTDGSWSAATGLQAQKDPCQFGCSEFSREHLQSTPRVLAESGENSCVSSCSDALAMAGLKVSPSKPTPCSEAGATQSPVDAARSIALENAKRRANLGSTRFDFGGKMNMKSLFEIEVVASTSTGCSATAEEIERAPLIETAESVTVQEPPKVMPNVWNSALSSKVSQPSAFLKTLTSPSLSMSPTSDRSTTGEDVIAPQSPTSSPLIQNTKMAEKVALASHAAAVTFEQQYHAAAVEMQHRDDDFDGTILSDLPSFFCAPEIGENLQNIAGGEEATNRFFGQESGQSSTENIAALIGETAGVLKGFTASSPPRDDHNYVKDLAGGAFSPWKNAVYGRNPKADRPGSISFAATSSSSISSRISELAKSHRWLTSVVLKVSDEESQTDTSDAAICNELAVLLKNDDNLNKLCSYVAEHVNVKIELENEERAKRNAPLSPRKKMRSFVVGKSSGKKSSAVIAANFVSFIQRVSKASGLPSPLGEENPFLLDLVTTSIQGTPTKNNGSAESSMQSIVFSRCSADKIVIFCAQVCNSIAGQGSDDSDVVESRITIHSSFDLVEASRAAAPSPTKKGKAFFVADNSYGAKGERRWIVPDVHPSPFECLVQRQPQMLASILGFLGDPAAVCRLKMANMACNDFIKRNEHQLMRDAVRLGGLSMHVRPSFWLWIILEKMSTTGHADTQENGSECLLALEAAGRNGKYHHVIQRDVERAFGNMPPHKTGSRLRTDSIVRALVTWGRNRIMKRGVRGDRNPPPSTGMSASGNYDSNSESEASQTRTDTVSDWGGVSPVPSFAGSCSNVAADGEERKNDDGKKKSRDTQSVSPDLLVLGGTALTDEMKTDLQGKLAFILHALAAKHIDVGYCQGMDYVVAHLLRILQETVCWRSSNGTLPASVLSASTRKCLDMESKSILQPDNTMVVEETIYRVMDSLFTVFNLQHMYWPELRCLKTCCRVFERLIQLKLPVLADHFEHHELNVGLFALGWFQTLFLYLPSMPSATVCHIWDIWLVERSFKIFFRVGTAILFLSQPILLNHELEGMMTYLNTFPDATLLNPDILIACALQIKVTNKMLMDIEEEVCGMQ